MMDLQTIIRLNRAAGRTAEKQGLEPYIAKTDEDRAVLHCPKLGYWVPDGWELTHRLFVDKTGLSLPDEPALSLNQFLARVKVGYGYAIYEEGEFQIWIGVYRRI